MLDIIQILPDAVANQIAAGEVIQRPASVVKELLENAIDAGATQIELIVKDAGKTLIQVNDNGKGMSETDARCCFERHATSKIRKADDLFAIKTMGFRGEALASIAAVAHVELKTRRREDSCGVSVRIEGSVFKEQQPCVCEGTSMAVKNLFFNVPARRKFLKSDTVENNHIYNEFLRVALINHEVEFTFYSGDKVVCKLEKSTFKQRITALFGNRFKEKLLPVKEVVEGLSIYGYIGKPDQARKTKGEQYFFVNQRFMKSSYLSHAVEGAYEHLLEDRTYPTFFLCITIDPREIDVNIHPTKTEVKFSNERFIYGVLRASVKKSLGQFELAPTISFEEDITRNIAPLPKGSFVEQPTIKLQTGYNPFDAKWKTQIYPHQEENLQHWNKLYRLFEDNAPATESSSLELSQPVVMKKTSSLWSEEKHEAETDNQIIFQVFRKYIVVNLGSGLVIIDQKRAHERVLYEQFLKEGNFSTSSQHLLFPKQYSFPVADTEVLKNIMPYLKQAGFDIEFFGNTTFIINGLPEYIHNDEVETTLLQIAERFAKNIPEQAEERKHFISLEMAKRVGVKYDKLLTSEEMQHLVGMLFACEQPNFTPDGKKIIETLSKEKLDQLLA